MSGVWVLLAAVVAAGAVALAKRWWDGRFRAAGEGTDVDVVTAEEIGAPLGERATLLQFSSAFCAPCRATRLVLAEVAAGRDDVAHVEVDAEANLGLVRRLGVLRTPTVVVLDGRGAVRGRASGAPRREQVEAALAVVDE
ncbi:MAG: thioredoxin family protein [Aeromicrobium sp.]|uniref:thioredoxin family protein n=1 Tax=Aeromicrobium sp. TaxID=1871063 RepID=UPI0039E5BBF4